jgi:hypothetical protein
MKRLVVVASLVLGASASLPAQQPNLLLLSPATRPASSPSANVDSSLLFPELAPPPAASFNSALPQPARPEAPPAPQGGVPEDFRRWDLGVGYEYIHFSAAAFSSNLSGLHTSLTYNLNEWFGFEGSLISAWGGTIFGGERTKYVSYTGGAHISAGPSRHRLTPWAHLLVGGVHVNPQLAVVSKNGFVLQAGGGGDYSLRPNISIRGEVDFVHTMLFSSSQNNFQIGIGAILHF